MLLYAVVDDLTELLLFNDLIYLKSKLVAGLCSVDKSEVLRKRSVEDTYLLYFYLVLCF